MYVKFEKEIAKSTRKLIQFIELRSHKKSYD
jgi:hypothetical protein